MNKLLHYLNKLVTSDVKLLLLNSGRGCYGVCFVVIHTQRSHGAVCHAGVNMASIKVYARVRPSRRPTERITISEANISALTGNAEASEVSTKHSTTPQLRHEFSFSHVFNATANQEDVFETAGKQIAVKFLDGYNGTIFAYGQTGSGKTYTMEGSARRFSERGLIPRVLSFVYSELDRRSDSEEFVVHISYMEIYQDNGYDLLNPGNTSDAVMTQLPKVLFA